VHTGFRWENLTEGDILKDTGVDVRIILKWLIKKLFGGHGLDRWRATVNAVMASGYVKCGKFTD
jgi:hypothetical protein